MEQAAERTVGSKGPTSWLTPEGDLTSDALRQRARNLYQQVDNNGVAIDNRAAKDAVEDVRQALSKENISRAYNPEVFKIVDKLTKPFNPNLRFGEVMENLQALSEHAHANAGTKEGVAAGIAHDVITNWVNNIPANRMLGGNLPLNNMLLQQANRSWGSYKTADLIETAIQDAERQAATTGKGTNLANTLRQKLRPILKAIDDGKMSVPKEVEDRLRSAVMGRTGWRALSAFAPTGSVSTGMDLMLEMALGHFTGPTAMVAGHVARKAEEAAVRNRALGAVQAAKSFGALNPARAIAGTAMATNPFAATQPVGRFARAVPAGLLGRVPGGSQDQIGPQ
jgi:hypothetical protein